MFDKKKCIFPFLQFFTRLIIVFSYFSIRKIANLSKLFIFYLCSVVRVQELHNSLPYFISIEASNYCNLHCPECPVGKREISTSALTFDVLLYKKIIDELKSTLLHVILYFQGEPFLHSQLNEMIRYAHEAHIFTSTSTNGQFLTEANAKKIVLSGLDKLIVSIDGSTQEIYETYRVGGSLQKAIDGIKQVVAWRSELNSSMPMIEIQFLVLKTNEHQMSEMKKLAKSLKVDSLTFKTAQFYSYENGSELLPTKTKFARYKKGKNGVFQIKGIQPNRCWRLWSGAVVNVHGEILPCCFDKASEYSFGNIQENSFYTCWYNEKASDFRERILQNRKQFEICKNCTSH